MQGSLAAQKEEPLPATAPFTGAAPTAPFRGYGIGSLWFTPPAAILARISKGTEDAPRKICGERSTASRGASTRSCGTTISRKAASTAATLSLRAVKLSAALYKKLFLAFIFHERDAFGRGQGTEKRGSADAPNFLFAVKGRRSLQPAPTHFKSIVED